MNAQFDELQQLIVQRLGIEKDDMVLMQFEQFVEIFQNKELAQIYYDNFTQYQDELFQQVESEQQLIKESGISPVEAKKYKSLVNFVNLDNQRVNQSQTEKFLQLLRNDYRKFSEDTRKMWRMKQKQESHNQKLEDFKSRMSLNISTQQQQELAKAKYVLNQELSFQTKMKRFEQQLSEKLTKAAQLRDSHTSTVSLTAHNKIQKVNKKRLDTEDRVYEIIQAEEKLKQQHVLQIFDTSQKISYSNPITARRYTEQLLRATSPRQTSPNSTSPRISPEQEFSDYKLRSAQTQLRATHSTTLQQQQTELRLSQLLAKSQLLSNKQQNAIKQIQQLDIKQKPVSELQYLKGAVQRFKPQKIAPNKLKTVTKTVLNREKETFNNQIKQKQEETEKIITERYRIAEQLKIARKGSKIEQQLIKQMEESNKMLESMSE
ncbi:Hypothetical_protein [Hexamita inflata]|uniref:Hypothetical_protein n=1 Tax=Hexamita inflata TaxID=28002 RepID=A0AA86Q985_9EUKA|nr:Hypothetical protein HINF_LOCUS40601 [Hexamita inflata]